MAAGIAALAALYGLWVWLTPHGEALFIAIPAMAALAVIYASSETPGVKLLSIGIFDIAVPAILALPLLIVAWAQLAAGYSWRGMAQHSDSDA